MTIEDAKAVVQSGPGTFGVVYPLLADADRESLRAWFVSTPDIRPAPAPARQTRPAPKPVAVPTGDLCPKCGGFMVQTGTCKTCHGCGESSGGCG